MRCSSRKAWVVLWAVWAGCSLATEFDRDKVPATVGGAGPDGGPQDGKVPDAGGRVDGRVPDAKPGDDTGTPVDPGPDSGMPPENEAGPQVQCTGNDGCEADQLCCNNLCVSTTVTSRCTSCTEGCDPDVANACNKRGCGCGSGASCSGDRPFCSPEGSCVECRVGLNDCAGRSDGKTQCIQGACAACDPTNNAGCGGTTPICAASTLTCVKCSMSPDNCPGKTVCTMSGACGGCDDAADCETPTAPICNMQVNPTVCRACAGDNECGAQTPRPYCITDGRCGVCKPVANAPDPGCDLASATPACRLNAGQYQCQGCTSNAQCAAAQGRPTCNNGRCVECRNHAECALDPRRPFCDSDGLCKSCAGAGPNFCRNNTLGFFPYCEASTGRCLACLDNSHCGGNTPICDASGVCRGCTVATEARDCGGNTPVCDGGSGRCVACAAPARGCSGANGSCLVVSGNPAMNRCVDCTGSVNGECAGATPHCNTSTNMCVRCTMDSHCNDNDMCTKDRCSANACENTALTPTEIADAFMCTDDSCNPASGVVHMPNHTRCDDSMNCRVGTCVGAGGDTNGCRFTESCTPPAMCVPGTGMCMAPGNSGQGQGP